MSTRITEVSSLVTDIPVNLHLSTPTLKASRPAGCVRTGEHSLQSAHIELLGMYQ
jgi:hypothetical protein